MKTRKKPEKNICPATASGAGQAGTPWLVAVAAWITVQADLNAGSLTVDAARKITPAMLDVDISWNDQ